MLDLYIHHGRKTPTEDLEDWGPNGPRLTGVTGIHQTYGNPANVFFVDTAARDAARAVTGWDIWEDKALTMRWQDDCLVADGHGGQERFFGDWGLIATAAA